MDWQCSSGPAPPSAGADGGGSGGAYQPPHARQQQQLAPPTTHDCGGVVLPSSLPAGTAAEPVVVCRVCNWRRPPAEVVAHFKVQRLGIMMFAARRRSTAAAVACTQQWRNPPMALLQYASLPVTCRITNCYMCCICCPPLLLHVSILRHTCPVFSIHSHAGATARGIRRYQTNRLPHLCVCACMQGLQHASTCSAAGRLVCVPCGVRSLDHVPRDMLHAARESLLFLSLLG